MSQNFSTRGNKESNLPFCLCREVAHSPLTIRPNTFDISPHYWQNDVFLHENLLYILA